MASSHKRILAKMLERLFAAMVNGPSLNCRPHSSRQRVDLMGFGKLGDVAPEEILRGLLGEGRAVKVTARVGAPGEGGDETAKRRDGETAKGGEEVGALSAEERAAEQAWGEQQALIRKARGIAEDARTYENDTGVHVLHIGFPLLSMPPGSMGAKLTRRVIAPIAFISVALTVKAGAAQSITLECRNEGADLVMPNTALLAWLEQQTGQPALEIDGDEEGTNPWQEIGEVVRRCAKLLELTPPEMFGGAEVDPANLRLQPAPRGDEGEGRPAILMSAVVGLFPTTNQGLLRDTQAMIAEPAVAGPIESFVKLDTSADKSAAATPTAGEEVVDKRKRVFAEDRLVSAADPCQCRAVKLARTSKNLVIHGPPGTGKSQTITNIIGDHLARGQRALLVCDKRTALDVVLNRLQSMGLDNLCAVVHDPQRDQRELYKSIREQLDALPEAQTDAGAEKKLAKADAELQKIHDELTKHTQALGARQGGPGGVGKSFHDLVGEWLALPAGEAKLDDGALVAVTMEELEGRSQELAEIFERAAGVDYRHNPWVEAAGMELEAFLATPMERFRGALAECQEKAKQADAAIDPAIPPFDPTLEIRMEGEERAALAEKLQPALQKLDSALVARWAKSDLAKIEQSLRKVNDASAFVQLLARGPLDGELALLARMSPPPVQAIGGQVAALDAFIAIVNKWYHFIKFKEKKEAQKVLGLYNLPISAGTAQRLRTFLIGLRARLVLSNVITQLGHPDNDPLLADEVIEASLRDHRQLLDLLRQVHATPALQPLAAAVTGAMTDPAAAAELLRGLRKSPARAKAIAALQDALGRSRLLDQAWLEKLEIELCQQKPAGAGIEKLAGSLDTLEAVLRVGKGLGDLPAGLRAGAQQLVDQDAAAEDAMRALEKAVIGQEIGRRLKSEPTLQALDGQRLKASFDRYRALEEQRRGLSRQVVAHNWVTRQKERLLASTGSRLNGQGAELRRRLAIRGERAMRLRQVIAAGMRGAGGEGERDSSDGTGGYGSIRTGEYTHTHQAVADRNDLPHQKQANAPAASRTPGAGGESGAVGAGRAGGVASAEAAGKGADPLFDLRPVWMASPETVAQIFPRQAIFDVVIFDEASQCRLEEALPVLARARRVVIAGDPKQLPPTRFFESAVASSDDEEIETDEQLFEVQQGEIEDLLGAALNIEIDECYLDVHYRSRNADLIQFSNQHFYGARLQAIPGHPANRTRYAPLTLYRVKGVYEKRCNRAEAEQVGKIIRDLFKRAEAPSIGVACFNLQQRDLIVEHLEELAAEDAEFAGRLAEARTRRGPASFEGLFVKNLENVQGDERDHMIISTTYGPDVKGKFYRRFGPLGRSGGGRRLNVLVTRAREEVHLVTSIPAEVYRALPPVPKGQTPTGGYLLFAYLNYAEKLAEAYETAHEVLEEARGEARATVNVRPARWPSEFAQALAEQLCGERQVGSDVHWGNDGFCVDLALHHPKNAEDVTIGVLCDATRFAQAQDPVEWEIFRTGILEGQGWKLHRVWTPHFFRDPRGGIDAIVKDVNEVLANEEEKDAIRVERIHRGGAKDAE